MTRLLTIVSLLCVLSAGWPCRYLLHAANRTALRSAAVWTTVALAVRAMAAAVTVAEAIAGPIAQADLLRLVASIMLLTPIVAILGARRPGERAWNWIVVILPVAFVLPLLAQRLLGRPIETGRIGLDTPWAIFYGLLVLVAICNYLPTRFGSAAVCFGGGAAIEVVQFGPWRVAALSDPGVFFAVSTMLLCGAMWLVVGLRRAAAAASVRDASWLRLRDGWGVLWSMRIRERWNATARESGWNLQLAWSGFLPVQPERPVSEGELKSAEELLEQLLRRFFGREDA